MIGWGYNFGSQVSATGSGTGAGAGAGIRPAASTPVSGFPLRLYQGRADRPGQPRLSEGAQPYPWQVVAVSGWEASQVTGDGSPGSGRSGVSRRSRRPMADGRYADTRMADAPVAVTRHLA